MSGPVIQAYDYIGTALVNVQAALAEHHGADPAPEAGRRCRICDWLTVAVADLEEAKRRAARACQGGSRP